jgi:hypothetical protein
MAGMAEKSRIDCCWGNPKKRLLERHRFRWENGIKSHQRNKRQHFYDRSHVDRSRIANASEEFAAQKWLRLRKRDSKPI